ncbi:MAG: DUF2752 domain-containing protein [Planctomycetales bacterium]
MSFRPGAQGYPLDRRGRIALLVWSLCLVAGFGVAWSIDPDPRGFGTHERLGLPPCSFQTMFAIPCPSCGMTTSFSNFVRGRFVAACEANLAGFLLAAACAIQVPWAWWSVRRGRLWQVSRPDRAVLWLLTVVCAVALLQWLVRLMAGNE